MHFSEKGTSCHYDCHECSGFPMNYEVLLVSNNISELGRSILEFFNADFNDGLDGFDDKLNGKKYRAVVFDSVNEEKINIEFCESLLRFEMVQKLPLIVLTSSYTLQDKLKAFDIGCDDFIDGSAPCDEVCARITKSVFHQIATEQLSQRLALATETAKSAMVDNSDLGANIQFLLEINACDNLDQLGQQFFATISRYGLSCSLQMRSEMGIKDMEANGMAKDLESQLLLQLQDKGRFVDFGKRTIVNYDRVSLLIKNMPLDDPEKYGAIKDNIFYMVQGVNARIIALEDRFKLLAEKEQLHKLSSDVNQVINGLKNAYQEVVTKIVNEVENAAEHIQNRVPHLALTEVDERFMDSVTENLIVGTNRVFNDGLKVNELFEKLEASMQKSLDAAKAPSAMPKPDKGSDNVVELF